VSSFDSNQFRAALGSYPTGVAIVTTRGADGAGAGLTINSFASLSLDPPLLLWSVASTANCCADFTCAASFAVHVLHEGQEALSRAFATKTPHKFAELVTECGVLGIPMLTDYHTRFQCVRERCVPGGDHTIVIGRVVRIDSRECRPLVFFRGKYRRLDYPQVAKPIPEPVPAGER
jgi:flavin reductase (DIM6/NTAB) family NADH-FMN oxidoreductase RutF